LAVANPASDGGGSADVLADDADVGRQPIMWHFDAEHRCDQLPLTACGIDAWYDRDVNSLVARGSNGVTHRGFGLRHIIFDSNRAAVCA
jgi:hypothetical protein